MDSVLAEVPVHVCGKQTPKSRMRDNQRCSALVVLPEVSSGVYVIDPRSKVIMHMYDDRGLDMIAAELETLRPLFQHFGDWNWRISATG